MHFAGIVFVLGAAVPTGATQNTENFVVHAPTHAIAERAAKAAETHRRELAIQWLGKELPRWSTRCVINVRMNARRPSGLTSFTFRKERIADLSIDVRGRLEDILDGVLPHEITHAVFATHFHRSLPRWADEGVATLSEGSQQQSRQRLLAADWLSSRRVIPLASMLEMTEYPRDRRGMTAVYLQGFSLVDFLVQRDNRKTFTLFLQTGHTHGWHRAIQRTYGYKSMLDLERGWKAWATRRQKSRRKRPAKPITERWVRNWSCTEGLKLG